jgi:phage tail protein X
MSGREERKKQSAFSPETENEPTPQAPPFAATGLMSSPPPDNRARLPFSAGIVATLLVVFGLGTATLIMVFGGDDSGPVQTAALIQQMEEAPTRAELPGMTDVSAAGAFSSSGRGPTADDLNAEVLAGLQPATADAGRARSALDVLGADNLRLLTASVQAGTYTIDTYEKHGHARVRLQTRSAQWPHAAAAELLLEAAVGQQLEVTPVFDTTDGGVDVNTLMFDLVQSSLKEIGTDEAAFAALDMSRKMFAASPVRSDFIDGVRHYTVLQGDSLAYIALQFYGRADAFTRILEANPETLQFPDMIQTGQRLVIPS